MNSSAIIVVTLTVPFLSLVAAYSYCCVKVHLISRAALRRTALFLLALVCLACLVAADLRLEKF